MLLTYTKGVDKPKKHMFMHPSIWMIFSKEILWLPSKREIKFVIDLVQTRPDLLGNITLKKYVKIVFLMFLSKEHIEHVDKPLY